MKHVLAIDQGTRGSTCRVVAAGGCVVGRGYREITQYFPQPGWARAVRPALSRARDAS